MHIDIRPDKLYSTDDEVLLHAQIMPDGKKYRVSNFLFFSSDMGLQAYFIFNVFLSDTPGIPLSGSVNRRI